MEVSANPASIVVILVPPSFTNASFRLGDELDGVEAAEGVEAASVEDCDDDGVRGGNKLLGSFPNRDMKTLSFLLNCKAASANLRFSATVVSTAPVVISSPLKKDTMPTNMVPTVQEGVHVSGWKSLIDRQIRVFTANLPLGVTNKILGGFKGYSGGNTNFP